MKKPIGFDKRLAQTVKRNAEAISQSEVFCVMHNEKMAEETVPVLQMGIAMYLDKPILILCPESRRGTIPKNVQKVAVAIEYWDDDPAGNLEMAMQAATMRLMQAAGLVK